MWLEELSLFQFRNYEHAEIAFSPGCNVIYGENAQGKTNLLEAVVYLSTLRSPRSRGDRDLLRFDCTQASLRGKIFSRAREFSLLIQLQSGKKRAVQCNGVPVRRMEELSGVLHTVYFSPEDLSLIRDGAAARRRFVDQSLSQLRPRYAAALSEYHRAYEHKTRILRDCGEKPSLRAALPEFSYRMAQLGAVLIHYRARFCQRLEEYAAAAHLQCSGGEILSLRYQTVKTVTNPFASEEEIFAQLLAHQRAHEAAELSSRLCLSGPHKDDIVASINGVDARQFSSQGQTRTAALALKLADREIHREITGEMPVLLLDDVLSELDPRRQEFVLNRISGGQVLISCCEEDRLGAMIGGRRFHVRQGRVAVCTCTSETM